MMQDGQEAKLKELVLESSNEQCYMGKRKMHLINEAEGGKSI